MKKRKIIVYIIFGILVVLIFTNPTLNQFEEFIGYQNGEVYYEKQLIKGDSYFLNKKLVEKSLAKRHTLKRESNWLIYSKYSHNTKIYFAFFNNFYN